MRNHWQKYVILLLLVNTLLFVGEISIVEGQEEGSLPSLNQDTNTTAYLELSETSLELGSSLLIKYGLINNSIYLKGHNFTLFLRSEIKFLENSNSSDVLLNNGTTSDHFNTHTLETSQNLEFYEIGNYSILYFVNTTDTQYNSSIPFEIIFISGARVSIVVYDTQEDHFGTEIESQVNESRLIIITLQNLGDSIAFNISFSFQPINEPVGLQSNNSQLLEIPFLASREEASTNFTINPFNYGLGQIQLNLEYKDGNLITFIPKTINIYTRPPVFVTLNLPNLKIGDKKDFDISIVNQISQDILVRIKVSSDDISFVNSELEELLRPGLSTHTFVGEARTVGENLQVTFEIDFFDLVDRIDLIPLILPLNDFVDVSENIVIPDISFTEVLYGLLIFINGAVLLFIILLYFRQDLRRKVLNKFFKMQYIPDIDFPKKSIIVDGSNIAWEEVNKKNKPQMSNILISIKHLKDYGFEEILVVVDAALRYQIDNKTELDGLSRKGIIKVLPAKVNGDSFILRLSAQKQSLILTNDLFKEFREEYPWIDDRRVPYTIMKSQFFLHPLFENKIKEN